MTTPYTWTSLQTSVAVALVQAPSPYTSLPPNFVQEFPNAVSYAEGRIARDLVLLNSRSEAANGSVTGGSQLFSLGTLTPPAGLSLPMVVVERIDLISSGVAYFYDRASLDFVRIIWPQPSLTLAPSLALGRFWAPLNDSTVVLAPTPDQSYPAVVTGLFVQSPMSSGNPTTYIGSVYGDLLFAAVMIFLSGALTRNYGAQADEPQQAMSWEQQYGRLLAGAESEEARRRGLSVDDLRSLRPAQTAVAA